MTENLALQTSSRVLMPLWQMMSVRTRGITVCGSQRKWNKMRIAMCKKRLPLAMYCYRVTLISYSAYYQRIDQTFGENTAFWHGTLTTVRKRNKTKSDKELRHYVVEQNRMRLLCLLPSPLSFSVLLPSCSTLLRWALSIFQCIFKDRHLKGERVREMRR